MEVKNALEMEGPLEKQSPSVLRYFQDRYFAIRNNGQFLVWFKKKPINAQQNPQGILVLTYAIWISTRLLSVSPTRRATGYSSSTTWRGSLRVRKPGTSGSRLSTPSWNTSRRSTRSRIGSRSTRNSHGSGAESIPWWPSKQGSRTKRLSLSRKTPSQYSNRILLKLLTNDAYEMDKCIIYGFNIIKRICVDYKRWYLLISEYNLQEYEDENNYDKNREILKQINQKLSPKKQAKQSQGSQEQEQENKPKQFQFQFNVIYEYDPETMTLKNQFPIINLISWDIQHRQYPNKLIINYFLPSENQDILEQQKQQELILYNDYLTELEKWSAAIKILFEKIGVVELREKLKEKKADKFLVKGWAFDSEWREPKDNKFYVLLNKENLKIGGNTIQLSNIKEVKKGTYKVNQSQDSKQQHQVQVVIISQKDSQVKFNVQCQSIDVNKKLYKRLNKFMKLVKKEEEKAKESDHQIKKQENEININTYYFDKKMRESTNNIKVNFYEVMQRDSTTRPKKKKEQPGIWGKFMGMFCGQPPQDDILL